MLNIIQMDFTRLIKSRFFLITLAFLLLLSLFTIVMLRAIPEIIEHSKTNENVEINYDESQKDMIEELTREEEKDFGYLVGNHISSSSFMTFLVILVGGLFITAEYKSGYIKNLLQNYSNRRNLVLSKVINLFIYFLILTVVLVVSTLIFGLIFLGPLTFNNVGNLFIYIIFHMIFILPVIASVVLISTLTQRSDFTILGALFIPNIFFTLLTLIDQVGILPLSLNWFNIQVFLDNFSYSNFTSISGELVKNSLLSVIYAVIMIIISIRIMNNRDF